MSAVLFAILGGAILFALSALLPRREEAAGCGGGGGCGACDGNNSCSTTDEHDRG